MHQASDIPQTDTDTKVADEAAAKDTNQKEKKKRGRPRNNPPKEKAKTGTDDRSKKKRGRPPKQWEVHSITDTRIYFGEEQVRFFVCVCLVSSTS
jgi:hypothetical protein